jgi:hypothetical protein
MLSLQGDRLHPACWSWCGCAELRRALFFSPRVEFHWSSGGYHKRSVQVYSHSGGFRCWSAALKPGFGLGAGYEVLSGRGSWTGGTRNGASTFIAWRALQRARPRYISSGRVDCEPEDAPIRWNDVLSSVEERNWTIQDAWALIEYSASVLGSILTFTYSSPKGSPKPVGILFSKWTHTARNTGTESGIPLFGMRGKQPPRYPRQ